MQVEAKGFVDGDGTEAPQRGAYEIAQRRRLEFRAQRLQKLSGSEARQRRGVAPRDAAAGRGSDA
jgi:hypothetical protein